MEISAKIVNVSILDIQLASEYATGILDLKSEIFAGKSFLKFSSFYYKKTDNCLAMKELGHIFSWILPNVYVELFFTIFCVVTSESTSANKSIFQVNDKKNENFFS